MCASCALFSAFTLLFGQKDIQHVKTEFGFVVSGDLVSLPSSHTPANAVDGLTF